MREVYLDDLPHRGNLICWNNSVGYNIPFVFEDIKGKLKIVSVNNKKKSVCVEYNGTPYNITTSKLIQAGLSRILGVNCGSRSGGFNIGDVFNNKEIVDITYKNKRRSYGFICKKCNEKNYQSEYNFRHCGCPVCNQSRVVVPEINGIKGKYPEIYRIIIDDDKDKYGSKSDHKVHWICPLCNQKNFTQICHLTESVDKKTYYPCVYCKKSFSIGENILYGVLSQISNNYSHHIKYKWSHNREYDACCNDVIIEAHGLQHYEETNFNSRTLKEEQENDKYKYMLAKNNYTGLRGYIVIDCRISDFHYIKNSILNSNMDKLIGFDYKDIDWSYIASHIKEQLFNNIAQLYNKGFTAIDIAKNMNINRTTVYNHLKFCENIGLLELRDDRNWNYLKKKVRCKNTNEIFDSAVSGAKWCGLKSSSSINSCCNNKPKFLTAGKHPLTGERLEWEFV